MSDPVYTPTVSAVNQMVTCRIDNLTPETRYHWAVEDAGVLDTSWQGQARTHPIIGTAASFTIAASSCAGLDTNPDTPGQVITSGISNHPVFATIRAADPLLTCHLGDENYLNRATNDVTLFRTDDTNVLTYNETLGAAALQGQLARSCAMVNLWDDHDFGGNNSDGTSLTRDAVNAVYRERKPSYALPDEGIYHSFQIGRVLFIAADTRTFRTPNLTPDSPAKTMLGAEQKLWMRQVLSSSDARALVWLLPTPWLGTGSDKWPGFKTERTELATMFTELGWANRMISVTGDRHALAIASASANPYGGFPEFMFGSLDSAGSGADPQYDLGMSAGNNRWGTIRVEDDGNRITITGTGMIGSSPWRSHSITIDTPIAPGPDPILPPETIGTARPVVQFFAVDARTGNVIDEVPLLTGPLGHILGASSSATFKVPLLNEGTHGYRPGVLENLTPITSAILAVVHDVPLWLGTILPRTTSNDPLMDVSAVTSEGYLARRFVRNRTYTGVDQATIAAGLLADAGDIPGVGYGQAMLVDAPLTGVKRDRTYLASDHKTVYEAIRELAEVEDGIEWTIRLRWADATKQRVVRVAEIRQRLGVVNPAPDVVFASGAECAPAWTYDESWSESKGANYVVAYSSGEGSSQPVSTPVVTPGLLASGVPVYEHHFQPSSSITSQSVLNAHARAEHARLRNGTNTWKVAVLWDAEPRIGVKWLPGDDVGLHLDPCPRFPNGWRGVVRPIGYSGLDPAGGRMELILQGDEP